MHSKLFCGYFVMIALQHYKMCTICDSLARGLWFIYCTSNSLLPNILYSLPVLLFFLLTHDFYYRNNSSQMLLVDTFTENALAVQRLLFVNMTISESTGSTSSSEHAGNYSDEPLHLDTSGSGGSAKFFIGEDQMSSDEEDEEEVE